MRIKLSIAQYDMLVCDVRMYIHVCTDTCMILINWKVIICKTHIIYCVVYYITVYPEILAKFVIWQFGGQDQIKLPINFLSPKFT